MTYSLTEHARDALVKRQIPLEWLGRALVAPCRREPDRVDEALEHRLAAIPEFGNRILRVIVNVQANPERVITAYFDRRARGER